MPTPILNFRLPDAERAALVEMSKLYGSKNVSEFLREMVGAMCSADANRVKAFNIRLFSKVGEQLALKLNATIDEPLPSVAALPVVPRVAKKRKKRRARVKRR